MGTGGKVIHISIKAIPVLSLIHVLFLGLAEIIGVRTHPFNSSYFIGVIAGSVGIGFQMWLRGSETHEADRHG